MHKLPLALALLLMTFPALSSKPAMGDEKSLIIDAIDIGAGLCTVLQAPSPEAKKSWCTTLAQALAVSPLRK